MIRSAAKNWQDVAIVTSPADYTADPRRTARGRKALARNEMAARETGVPDHRRLRPGDQRAPRAGRRRARAAACRCSISERRAACRCATAKTPINRPRFTPPGSNGIAGAEQLHGKELSYNNLVDLDAALAVGHANFPAPAAAIIKHTNPAGCAEHSSLAEAYRKALECDPVSAFGGVIGLNREVDEETATELAKLFVEAIAAPAYSDAALADSHGKEKHPPGARDASRRERPARREKHLRRISRANRRSRHVRSLNHAKSRRAASPLPEEWTALEFALESRQAREIERYRLCARRADRSSWRGTDEPRRFGQHRRDESASSARTARWSHRTPIFPFPDGLEEAAKYGATAFIQPGGSVKDADVIAAADRLGVAMVFTGVRHFRH